MNSSEKKVVVLTGLAHALNHGYMMIFPAVLTAMKEELGIGYFSIGTIGNICYLLFGLGALPAGVLADRIGSKIVIILFASGAGLSSLSVGMSSSILSLSISLGLLGAFASLYHPSGLALISKSVRRRGEALGFHGMAGTLGLAFSPFIAGWIGSRFGWRMAYIFFSLPGLSLAILTTFLLRADEEKANDTLAGEFDSGQDASSGGTLLLPLTLLYLTYALSGLCYRGVITFLPAYLSETVYGGSLNLGRLELGSSVTTLALLMGAAGQYAGGRASEKFSLELLLISAAVVSTPFLFLIGFTRNAALIAIAMSFAFFYFWGQPVQNGLVAKYTSRSVRSSAYGISFLMAFGVGSFASSLSGYVAEHAGLKEVFLAMGGISLLVVINASFILRAARGSPRDHPHQQ